MSAGIGGIGGMGGNIGGNIGVNPGGMIKGAAAPPDNLNAEALNNIHHKKHKEGDGSIEALIINLNNQKVAGAQSSTTGETGTRINKYA